MGRASSSRTSSGAAAGSVCASCKCVLGKATGKIPFRVDDHAGVGGDRARHESFCAPCFVYVRSPREPERWRPGFFLAVRCASCGLESVSIGQAACMQCGSRSIVVLPPKPGVV